MPDAVVTTSPAINGGQPSVAGVTVGTIAGLIAAGDSIDAVAVDYRLTRGQVLVACWHEARHGQPAFRRAWSEWAGDAYASLWEGRHDVQAPPAFMVGGRRG